MAPQSCHESGECPQLANLSLDLSSTTADERYTEECNDRLKCVLVGDGAVGKTSLVVSYSTNGYPTEYVPTAFDNFSVRINIDGRPVKLQICDTAGQDDFDRLRPLCYPGCDVILVCFSVVRPTSLSNVRHKWVPEMKKHLPKVPIVVVGTQTDLRTSVDVLVDLSRYSERPVTEEEGKEFARQCGASAYIECSALTQKNLKEVFDCVVEQALNFQAREERKRNRSWRKKGASSPVKREQDQWKKLVVKHKTAERWRRFFCLS